MKHILGKSKGEEHDFWMSYTDLMSGFLVVFIIGCIVMYQQYQEEKTAYEKVCEELHIENPDSLKQRILTLNNMLDSINASNLRNEIGRYKNVFVSTDEIDVEFKYDRGSIVLKHRDPKKELFESGEHSLYRKNDKTPLPLKPYLSKIYKALVDTTMSIAKQHDNIEIRIEGHTDPTWGDSYPRGSIESYIKNLELSSQRANTVFAYILNGDSLSETQRDFIMKHMISVGYSFSERVENNNIEITSLDPASRRIEFRIISK